MQYIIALLLCIDQVVWVKWFDWTLDPPLDM